MDRYLVITLAACAVFALGLAGSTSLDPEEPLLHHAYRVMQLFVLEGDWTLSAQPLPWSVEVARVLAPLLFIATIITVFARDTLQTLHVWSARLFYNRHIILVGLSDLAIEFLRSCVAKGRRVVVVERDQDNPYVEECRQRGVPVVRGDGFRESILRLAGIASADYLVTLMEPDGNNVELTVRARAVRAASGAESPLKIRLHVRDLELATRLEEYPKFFSDPDIAEVSFFNVDEQSARTLFRELPPDVYADCLGATVVDIAVLGFSTLAEQVVLEAARTCHYANQAHPAIRVICQNANDEQATFAARHPDFSPAADLSFLEARLSAQYLREHLPALLSHGTTLFVVAVGTDAENLSAALVLRRLGLTASINNAPIAVALRNADGLAQLLESCTGQPELPDGLFSFGMLNSVLAADVVTDIRQDLLAQAFHEAYLNEASDQDSNRASHRPWWQLPEMFRKESRLAADHLEAKLRAVGCRIAKGSPVPPLGDAELERMARMEKARWVAARYSFGWQPGPLRNDLAKVHPQMMPWQELPEHHRRYDLSSAASIPNILKERLGLGVVRDVVIGITGHRHDRLDERDPELERRISAALNQIAERNVGATFVILSPLAEGADRLVARLAMTKLDARLHVPIPMPYELYVRDFVGRCGISAAESATDYRQLIGQAERYYEMPLKFGGVTLLGRNDPSGREARARQYALTGAFIALRTHELIAVWDGEDAEGEGGTAQIIEWRRRGSVPEPYRWPGVFFPMPVLGAPIVIPVSEGAADGTAGRPS